MAYHFDISVVLEYAPELLKGAVITLELTAVGAIGGLLLGVLGAWGKTRGPGWLKQTLAGYVGLIRNTPFLVQLCFLYFGLPSLGIRLSGLEASFLAIVFNMGAYNTEIIRAGIEATPKGQFEAAQSMAMAPWQIFIHVVLRPAIARVWPALCSQIVLVMLDSAVCSQVTAEELTNAANWIQSKNFRAFETYVVVTAMYFCMAFFIRRLLAALEPAIMRGRRNRA